MDKYEDRRRRLLEIRNTKCDGKNSVLATALGREASYVSRMLSEPGKAGRKRISDDMIDVIERAFPGWLGNHDPMRFRAVETTIGAIDVPRMNAIGGMGIGRPLPEHDAVVDHMRLTADWVRSTFPSLTNPACLAVVSACGDSMRPTFDDGDVLLVDTGIADIKIDAVYVLALDDELYIKRLQRRPDGNYLMISDNKSYEPYVVQTGERHRFRVLGRVLFVWNGRRV